MYTPFVYLSFAGKARGKYFSKKLFYPSSVHWMCLSSRAFALPISSLPACLFVWMPPSLSIRLSEGHPGCLCLPDCLLPCLSISVCLKASLAACVCLTVSFPVCRYLFAWRPLWLPMWLTEGIPVCWMPSCMPVCLSEGLPVCLSAWLNDLLPTWMFVWRPPYLPVCLSAGLLGCLCLSECLLPCLTVCLKASLAACVCLTVSFPTCLYLFACRIDGRDPCLLNAFFPVYTFVWRPPWLPVFAWMPSSLSLRLSEGLPGCLCLPECLLPCLYVCLKASLAACVCLTVSFPVCLYLFAWKPLCLHVWLTEGIPVCWMPSCISVFLSEGLPACLRLSECLPFWLYVCLIASLCAYLFAGRSPCLPFYLPECLSEGLPDLPVCLHECLLTCLSICPKAFLSACLCMKASFSSSF